MPSLRQVAKSLDVSHVSILRAIKVGSLKVPSTSDMSIEQVRNSEWYRNRKRKPVAKSELTTEEQERQALEAKDKIDLEKIQIIERTESLRLDNEERKRNLWKADEVLSGWAAIVSAARSVLLLLPAKLGHKVAPIADATECAAIIDKEIKAALRMLSEYKLDGK